MRMSTALRALLLCALLAGGLVGCGQRNTAAREREPAVGERQSEKASEPDTIDPLEGAATIGAGESREAGHDNSSEGQGEADNTVNMEIPLPGAPGVDQRSAVTASSRTQDAGYSLPETAADGDDRASGADPAAAAAPRQAVAGGVFAAPASHQSTPLIERELLRIINQERRKENMEDLGVEESMQFAARIRAQEALDSLSHTRPDGTPYHTVFDEAGFRYAGKWHGENLAIIHVDGVNPSEEDIAAALFEEYSKYPGHHNNMVEANFYQTGVGVHIEQVGEQLYIGAAQLFAGL